MKNHRLYFFQRTQHLKEFLMNISTMFPGGESTFINTLIVSGIGYVTHKYGIDEKINNLLIPKFKELGEQFGKLCTLNLASWEYSKGVWNNTLEPLVILGLKLPVTFINGVVNGLLSDNDHKI